MKQQYFPSTAPSAGVMAHILESDLPAPTCGFFSGDAPTFVGLEGPFYAEDQSGASISRVQSEKGRCQTNSIGETFYFLRLLLPLLWNSWRFSF